MSKVLFIGGTGEISYACVEKAVAMGMEVWVFNRGKREEPLPPEVKVIRGDLNDDSAYGELGKKNFDVVCQFLAYEPEVIHRDIAVFGGRCEQYVFISSASAYQKPPQRLVITEDVPLDNPYWLYSRKKIEMERLLLAAHAAGKIRVTIVRPSHTHRTRFPGGIVSGDDWGWRMLNDKPILVHGDGTSLWTLTYRTDFAEVFVRLLGKPAALGEAFHITRHLESFSWREIYLEMGRALGVEPRLVCVPSDTLVRYRSEWAGPLLGDRTWSVFFDNSKVMKVTGEYRCQVSLREGMERAAAFFRRRLANYRPDMALHHFLDRIAADQERIGCDNEPAERS